MARESVADGSIRPVLEGYALPAQEMHAVYPSPKLVPTKVATFIAFLQGRSATTGGSAASAERSGPLGQELLRGLFDWGGGEGPFESGGGWFSGSASMLAHRAPRGIDERLDEEFDRAALLRAHEDLGTHAGRKARPPACASESGSSATCSR